MLKSEFLEQTELYGISLNALGIYVDEICGGDGAISVIEKDGTWLIYKADDRNNISLYYSGNEDFIFQKLYTNLFLSSRMERYKNKYITEEVIKTPSTKVMDFLITKYGMKEKEAKMMWFYLCRDFKALNEFKYYVLTEEFVPEGFCTKRDGFSAEDMCNKRIQTLNWDLEGLIKQKRSESVIIYI